MEPRFDPLDWPDDVPAVVEFLVSSEATAWARAHSGIDWIDLGVFSDNPGAHARYLRFGFQVLGRTPDRFRVDGHSLDDTWMTLHVSQDD